MNRYGLGVLVVASCALLGYALWPRAAFPHAQVTTTVQFDREIVRVLDDHCVMCHVDHGLAFPLITYEQTYAARWQIRMDALDRHMAPWAAVPGYGIFANDNALTQREADFLVSWAESFGPRNNGAVYTGVAADLATPKPVQAHFDLDRWALGKPDLLLRLPANAVAPRQSERVQRVSVDPRLSSTRWLRALEYQPGDHRVVHAVVFTVQETGQWLGSWTPWRGFSILPQGLAYRLAAGCHILAAIHYYGAKEPVVDQGSLALYFTNRPSPRAVADLVLDAQARKLDAALNILALQPTLQPGLQSVEVRARTPDGATQVLLFANDIPLAWPTPYVFANPVSLPKGSELSVIAHFAGKPGAQGGIATILSTYTGAPLPVAQPLPPPAHPVTRRFRLTGVVKSVDAANGRLVVEQGDIPGFMGAMTMTYSVSKGEDLVRVAAGDQIQSDLVSSDTGTYLENIAVERRAK